MGDRGLSALSADLLATGSGAPVVTGGRIPGSQEDGRRITSEEYVARVIRDEQGLNRTETVVIGDLDRRLDLYPIAPRAPVEIVRTL